MVIFSKTSCPHSAHVKTLLEGLPLKEKPVVHEVDRMAAGREAGGPSGEEVMDRIAAMTGARTTPRVFIEGKCIGGDDATAALNASGELKMMLQEAGAM